MHHVDRIILWMFAHLTVVPVVAAVGMAALTTGLPSANAVGIAALAHLGYALWASVATLLGVMTLATSKGRVAFTCGGVMRLAIAASEALSFAHALLGPHPTAGSALHTLAFFVLGAGWFGASSFWFAWSLAGGEDAPAATEALST